MLLPVGNEVLVEVDPKRVVEQVRGDHQAPEGRQLDDLVGYEMSCQALVELVGNRVRVARKLPPVVDDRLLAIVQLLTWLVSLSLFLIWFYRANANARAMGAEDLMGSPGLSVGWFFIPRGLNTAGARSAR